jgi:pyruvate/2-oxoglutarate dehydrogenase complex dihydrolipoamide acyltransferase (E2) component
MVTLDKQLAEVETEKLQLELDAVQDLIEELTF